MGTGFSGALFFSMRTVMENETRRAGIAPDVQRFFIPVELDRTRVLAFDSAATFLIYQKYGAKFFWELYERDPENPKVLRLRSHEAVEFFLWAGLQRDAKAAGEMLTLEDVSAMILPTTIDDVVASLLIALSATQRRPVKKDESKNG
jgi:hypothetical protein